MVATPSFIRPANVKALAAHYLAATEPLAARDAVAEKLGDAAALQPGSVAVARADLPREVSEALSIKPGATLGRAELENVLAGKRADGTALPRAPKAQLHNRVTVLDMTLNAHISVGLARELATTVTAKAAIERAVRDAGEDTMRHFEKEVGGYVRRGAGGRLGEEAGRLGWIRVTHHTTKETKDGMAAPQEHNHFLVPNLVVTDSGHVGAINGKRLRGRVAELTAVFQQSLHGRLEKMGAKVALVDGAAVMTEIPASLSAAMSRRSTQAIADAKTYAKEKGLDWEALPQKTRTAFIKTGAKKLAGSRMDGVADRAAYVAEAAAHGFQPRDLVQPGGSMAERAQRLREATARTLDAAVTMRRAAVEAGRAVPSIAAVAAERRATEAVATITAGIKQAMASTSAALPGAQARLQRKTAAVRASTAQMLSATMQKEAKRLGHEFRVEIERYRLRQIAAVVSTVVRSAVRVMRSEAVARAARSLRNAAGDTLRAAVAGSDAMARTFQAQKAQRLSAALRTPRGAGSVLPIAARRGAMERAAAAPELPVAKRAAALRQGTAATHEEAKAVMRTPEAAEHFAARRIEAAAPRLEAPRAAQAAQEAPAAQAATPTPAASPAPPPAPRAAPRVSTAERLAAYRAQQAVEMGELRNALRANAGSIAHKLLGKPDSTHGHDWRWGAKGSLKVTVGGAKAGTWFDHSTGEGGDMLKLAQSRNGGNFPAAVAWARAEVGMPEKVQATTDEARARLAAGVQAARERQQEAATAAASEKVVRQEEVAQRAAKLVRFAEPATAEHPYLAAKGLPADGLKIDKKGNLLIPRVDETGKVWSVQRIAPDGAKRFSKDGRADGTFHVLGKVDPGRPVAFAEGWATARSVNLATGLSTVVTFSAGNMERVMVAWRERNPSQVMIAAGDNDHEKPRQSPPKPNVGAELVARLAASVGAVPALPPFMDHEKGKDWNDHHKQHGLGETRLALRAAYAEAMNKPSHRAAVLREVPWNETAPKAPTPRRPAASEGMGLGA